MESEFMEENNDSSASIQRGLMVNKASELQSGGNGGPVDFKATLLKKPTACDDHSVSNWSDDDVDLDGFEIEDVEIPSGIPNLCPSKQERKQLWRPWAHALIVKASPTPPGASNSRIRSASSGMLTIRPAHFGNPIPDVKTEVSDHPNLFNETQNQYGPWLLLPNKKIASKGFDRSNVKSQNKKIIQSNTFQVLEHFANLMELKRIDPDGPILENEVKGKKPQRPQIEAIDVLNDSSHSTRILHDVTNLPMVKNLQSEPSSFGKGRLIGLKLNQGSSANKVALNFKRKREKKHFDFGKSTAQGFQGYLDGSELAASKDNMVKIASDLKNLAKKDLASKRNAGVPNSRKYIVPTPPDDMLANYQKDVNHMDALVGDVPKEGIISPTNSKESSF